jgi:hypothetical protein
MRNTTSPHTAILSINIKIHENIGGNSLNPSIMSEEELKEHGVTKHATVSVTGFNLENCIEKLKEKLEKFNG